MSNLNGLTGRLLVEHMTKADIEIVFAASLIVMRVFNVKAITARLEVKLSDTAVYNSIHKLSEAGVFNIISGLTTANKMKDRVLNISFTQAGREICSMVKVKQEENKSMIFQPHLI